MISSALFLVAVTTIVASDVPNSGHFNDETQYQCKQVPRTLSGLCADYFGRETWHGRFPNTRGLDMDDSVVEFFHFFALLYQDNYCSYMLHNLLCFHYFPLCSTECPGVEVAPCRQLCAETVKACLPYARALYGTMFENGRDFPHYLNCSSFEATELDYHTNRSSVYNSTTVHCSSPEEKYLDCPSATIHIDFSPPIGSQVYQVTESAGSVEICVILANVGSYDPTTTLGVPVMLQLSTRQTKTPSASLDDDYVELVASLAIPAGSIKGEKHCIEVAIIDDHLREGRESFSVEATVSSPTTAGIGRAKSSTGSIEVIINDDDEPFIPENECKNKCSIRNRANSNTFLQNSYTYVAHIEALGRRDSNDSSILDVVILECWELGADVCPQNHSKYSIPVCHDCHLDFTGGEEYLIAGHHVQDLQRNWLYLPDYRKGGLFAVWRKSYSSVGEWVMAANSQTP